jgi:Plasmid encoded RepA protein
MREVGLNPDTGGGKRGDAKRLHNQMDRLFGSRISFQYFVDDPHRHGKAWLNMEVAPRGELWWDPKRPDQGALWQSWILLGDEFYNALVALPVPVDMRALRALKRSPLALDLYAWVCYRAFVIVVKFQQRYVKFHRVLCNCR